MFSFLWDVTKFTTKAKKKLDKFLSEFQPVYAGASLSVVQSKLYGQYSPGFCLNESVIDEIRNDDLQL